MSPAGAGRRRRYVAPPRRLGPADEGLVARVPVTPAETSATTPQEPATGAGAPGHDDELVPNRASEDTDAGWGEYTSSPDSANDDRLRRDRPPHW